MGALRALIILWLAMLLGITPALAKQAQGASPTPAASSSSPVPCRPGEDVRSSELCAQWAAVDVARASVRTADRSVTLAIWSLIVGGLTLVAAGIAAWTSWQAARAAIAQARHAEADAKEAQRDRERQFAVLAEEVRGKTTIKNVAVTMNHGQPCRVDFVVANDGAGLCDFVRMSGTLIIFHPDSGQIVYHDREGRIPGVLDEGAAFTGTLEFNYPREAVEEFGNASWFEFSVQFDVHWRDRHDFDISQCWMARDKILLGNTIRPDTTLIEHLAAPVARES